MTHASPTTTAELPAAVTNPRKILALKASIQVMPNDLKTWLNTKTIHRLPGSEDLAVVLVDACEMFDKLNDEDCERYNLYEVGGAADSSTLALYHPNFGYTMTVSEEFMAELNKAQIMFTAYATMCEQEQRYYDSLLTLISRSVENGRKPDFFPKKLSNVLTKVRQDNSKLIGFYVQDLYNEMMEGIW